MGTAMGRCIVCDTLRMVNDGNFCYRCYNNIKTKGPCNCKECVAARLKSFKRNPVTEKGETMTNPNILFAVSISELERLKNSDLFTPERKAELEKIYNELHWTSKMLLDKALEIVGSQFDRTTRFEKVNAIKQLKELSYCGLRESKDAVELAMALTLLRYHGLHSIIERYGIR